jgi:hypothetical protein
VVENEKLRRLKNSRIENSIFIKLKNEVKAERFIYIYLLKRNIDHCDYMGISFLCPFTNMNNISEKDLTDSDR